MTIGYSMDTAIKIRNADSELLGVQLGQLCLRKSIPVRDVARELGVTERTVYSWFTGKHAVVREPHRSKVHTYLDTLRNQ